MAMTMLLPGPAEYSLIRSHLAMLFISSSSGSTNAPIGKINSNSPRALILTSATRLSIPWLNSWTTIATTSARIPYHSGMMGLSPGNPIIILGETAEVLGICQARVACQASNRNIRIMMKKTVTTQTSPTLLQNRLYCASHSMKSFPAFVLHMMKERPHTRSRLYFSKWPSCSAHLTPGTQISKVIANCVYPENNQNSPSGLVVTARYRMNRITSMNWACLRIWTSIGIPVQVGSIFSSSSVTVLESTRGFI